MQYQCEIEIELPRDRVIELFDDPDNLKEWQPDLILFEHMSGEAGTVGAKSRILYQMGKREIEMIETITVRNLPDEFSGTYDAKGVWNEVKNYFYVTERNTTLWTSDITFKFSGFMKIIAFLFPSAFKKQSIKFMEQFKAFAEGV